MLEVCTKAVQAHLLKPVPFFRRISVRTQLALDCLVFLCLALTVSLNYIFPPCKGILDCERIAQLSRCPVHDHTCVRHEGRNEAGEVGQRAGYRQRPPWAVPMACGQSAQHQPVLLGQEITEGSLPPPRPRACQAALRTQPEQAAATDMRGQCQHSDACNRAYEERALW